MPKILIVSPNWIGDALLAQPLLARLLQKYPGAAIDALAPAWTAPVLRRMPQIAEVIDAPFAHGELGLGARLRLAAKLRARRYDEAFVLPNTLKSALIPFLAGIPVRTGFVGELRYGLLNRVHRLEKPTLPLMAERYAQLAEAPGAPVQRPLIDVKLRVDPENLSGALSRLGLERSKPMVAFCPGAEYGPAKRWPARHFAELAITLAARGRAVWLFGSGKDNDIGEQVVHLSRGTSVNLCGKTDLASAIDLLSLAEVVVSNDSGLMHVAAAVGRPVVALYGSSSPEHTPPLSRTARLVSIGIDCSPCYARECPLGHFKCMNDLAPARVLGEIESLPPGAQ
ncbi:MAG TPA: lipopolysaccharide heptosyltransferase II [Burkholderiales bacterium]|nr:lipopolysaccharide heptosyltransferase II [Burkholderiales bacterium]